METLDVRSMESWPDLNGRVVLLAPATMKLLSASPVRSGAAAWRSLLSSKPACIVVRNAGLRPEILEKADRAGIAVLRTASLAELRRFLLQRLEARISMHGVLVRIFGLGALIIGESAVGKSEAALDLVQRGHQLVADDMVVLESHGDDIRGKPTDMGVNLLQIRGMGIINIRDLFGKSATARSATVGLVVELEEWQQGRRYSLIGLREQRYRILNGNLPYVKLPVKTGRNMATLIEVAVRNQLLKNSGVYTARDLNRRLLARLAK
jgi:HPr kinase/phosphorylase